MSAHLRRASRRINEALSAIELAQYEDDGLTPDAQARIDDLADALSALDVEASRIVRSLSSRPGAAA